MEQEPLSFSAITHLILRAAREPLPFAEIMARVAAQRPMTTRDPKTTIRGVLSASRLLVSVGDGRYGWKPHLISGAVLRLPLDAEMLASGQVVYPDEVRDALFPAFFSGEQYLTRDPVAVALPDGTTTVLSLEHGISNNWGATLTPELRHWLAANGAAGGDDLLLTVVDADRRRYALALERRQDRDMAAVAERNQAAVARALELAVFRNADRPIFDITARMLVEGFYHHPIAPEPLERLLVLDESYCVLGDRAMLAQVFEPSGPLQAMIAAHRVPVKPDILERLSRAINDPRPIPEPLPRSLVTELQQLIEMLDMASAGMPMRMDEAVLFEDVVTPDEARPPDLPDEYLPGPNRRPRPSAAAQRGPTPTVVLRVTHQDKPKVYRDLELALDQTLEDLHLAIQDAYRWDDDHLYSFFMSGKPYDRRSEIGSPWSDTKRSTYKTRLSSLKLTAGRRFLYLFDYGDDHQFMVEVLRFDTSRPRTNYPRIVGRKGRAPGQYDW